MHAGTSTSRTSTRFIVEFVAFVMLSNVLLAWADQHGGFPALQAVLAHGTSWLGHWLGIHTIVSGSNVEYPAPDSGGLSIVFGCAGLMELSLFWSGVFAMRCDLPAKTMGYVIGAIAVMALNWVRLAALLWIQVHWPNQFETWHTIAMQGFLILTVVPVWMVWAAWAAGRKA